MELSDVFHVQFKKSAHREKYDGTIINYRHEIFDHIKDRHGDLEDIATRLGYESMADLVADYKKGGQELDLSDPKTVDQLHESAHEGDHDAPRYPGMIGDYRNGPGDPHVEDPNSENYE